MARYQPTRKGNPVPHVILPHVPSSLLAETSNGLRNKVGEVDEGLGWRTDFGGLQLHRLGGEVRGIQSQQIVKASVFNRCERAIE